jgi:hypothetical protein
MIGKQLAPALLVFLLHHKDGLTVTDITGKPFCEQTMEFQESFIIISTIYETLKREGVQQVNKQVADDIKRQTEALTGPRAVNGQWV